MLIKDIGTTRAIIDLVDNCVDGARNLRPQGNYSGLWVKAEAKPSHFEISDNCGGIPVDLARNYAFRFGRPEEMKTVPSSIGQFGVGMKRALFKLGRKFRIESTTPNSRFVIEEDVDKWKQKKEWEFEFKELEVNRRRVPVSETGTVIRVAALHPTIAESFSLESFQSRFAAELSEAHIQSTASGLSISLNSTTLKHRDLALLESQALKPAFQRIHLNGNGKVNVLLYAGIADSDPSAAGWYVFCNRRLVLSADQTAVTGWGETKETTVPRYHNQFARFRGYAFFDAKDASLLPWNTTKTGVDSDSPKYRAVRLEMVKLMRPVIDFLNRLDAEKGHEVTDDKSLELQVKAAKPKELSELTQRPLFVAPKTQMVKVAQDNARIQYVKPLSKVRKAQKALKVSTLRDVGERTFDYFYERECEE